ncbi:unannotated protein [freshwater metagenome]|uniref:Unannotated protein n=1 Tax=freshwater metagenome TaxID=449393 RepID=A0A6J7KCQ4_9ZZZZ|nr:hypothetical protein [Actinomycetota bacterium]
MTENVYRHTLATSEINQLRNLIGEELRFVGGENLDAYSLAESIVVSTDSGGTKISCGLTDGDFEGFEDEYPIFMARKASAVEIKKIEDLGNVNLSLSGSRISGVTLVREIITCKLLGETSWMLESDIGLVIHFKHAAVSFVNLTDYDIVCRLSVHSNFEPSDLPSTKTLQENDLVNSYEVSRALLPLTKEAPVA